MAAVAATAALLATLNRRGLSPERSQVVTAGAATMPVLRPLLLAATTPPERLLPNPIQPALASPVEQAGARVPAPLGPALSTPTFRFPPPPPRAQTSASCRPRCMVNRKYSKAASATA